MEKIYSPRERRKLQEIMMKALKNEIRALPPEFQYLLTDDIATAIQNRIAVFQRIHSKDSFARIPAEKGVV